RHHDLRARADDGHRAHDRARTRPQEPFGARRAAHGAPGPVSRRGDRRADLARALAYRGDPAGDGPAARPGAARRPLYADPAVVDPAVLLLSGAAFLRLGAR